MKIENYTGTADTFTFPHNPNVFDDSLDSNHEITNIGFQRNHILVSGGGINPSILVLTGHFDGSSKWTDYRNLSKHFGQTTQLKKLFFESDKFYLCVGKQLKKTHTGGRTNFIDYVASFETVVGMLFGSTEKSSGTNDGNAVTFVTEITGTVDDGDVDITMTDNVGNQITIPASALTTDHDVVYTFVKMVDSGSGILVSEYSYVTVNSVQTKAVQTTAGFGILQVDIGEDISLVSTTNMSSVTKKFRDGYVD